MLVIPLTLVGMGMLVYTAINSAGYYLQRRAWIPVIMFAVILLLSLLSIARLFDAFFSLIRIG
jgi:hypothetical protein